MNIIILESSDQAGNDLFKLSDKRFDHIKNILKSERGDIIEIGVLNGGKGKGEITSIDENEVALRIYDVVEEPASTISIDLICALPRPQTLKKVLNICGMTGIRNLYLIRSEKVEKSYFHSPLLKKDNYSQYLIEGLSQGKRTKITNVSIHNRFKLFFNEELPKFAENTLTLIADTNSKDFLRKDLFADVENVVIAIGPEGGWNEFETQLIKGKGFIDFKLSSSILRVENAVNASLAQIELLLNS